MSNILVIDDDGLVREALEIFLVRAGHHVTTAADGGLGVAAFMRNRPDLVVLDRSMPGMNGSAVLDRIREVSATIPVVMLSGYDEAEDAANYLRSGATAFLSKQDGLLKALDEINRILGVPKKITPPPARRPEPPPAPAIGSKGLVLLVDDDESASRALSRFLASYGYEVIYADNGEKGLELARTRRPAVVILDISMPIKDGVAVLQELVPEMPGTGFIMLSGNSDENVARACLKIGAYDYLNKPANLGALETLVRTSMLTSKPA